MENNQIEPMALVQVRPDVDPRVIALYQESVKLLQYAQVRVVQNDDDVKATTDDLSVIAGVKRAVEAKRVEYTSPLNDHLRMVNDMFKRFISPLQHADVINREKVLIYRAEQERVRLEQERINQLRLEAARAEMQLKGEITESVGLVEVSPEAPTRYRTDMGTTGTAKTKKWEVVDLAMVPIEYHMIDAARVGKVVRAGIPSIPGIRIWEEEGLRVVARKPE